MSRLLIDETITFSTMTGEKNQEKARILDKTGKLETQNGMAKNLNACHL